MFENETAELSLLFSNKMCEQARRKLCNNIFLNLFFCVCSVSDWGSRLYDVLDCRNTGQQQPWWGCETFFLLFYFTCLLEVKVAVEKEKSSRHVAMVVKFLDDNKPKTSLEKWIHTLSKFIDLMQFHFICQIMAKFSGVKSVRIVSEFRGRKRKFCLVLSTP